MKGKKFGKYIDNVSQEEIINNDIISNFFNNTLEKANEKNETVTANLVLNIKKSMFEKQKNSHKFAMDLPFATGHALRIQLFVSDPIEVAKYNIEDLFSERTELRVKKKEIEF
eukprot:TRINITY_DN63279_c0_g1_i1.p6 TRINITY_DN63279_c0_g1~~TRINITY_DN63279_c0_g1_i1.p6  ORF type:complete len:113 (+),score=12.62 TRINITY_DN63279_c0_g1_i1:701-1039(+)